MVTNIKQVKRPKENENDTTDEGHSFQRTYESKSATKDSMKCTVCSLKSCTCKKGKGITPRQLNNQGNKSFFDGLNFGYINASNQLKKERAGENERSRKWIYSVWCSSIIILNSTIASIPNFCRILPRLIMMYEFLAPLCDRLSAQLSDRNSLSLIVDVQPLSSSSILTPPSYQLLSEPSAHSQRLKLMLPHQKSKEMAP